MASNLETRDSSEKRISLVYNSDITGFQALDFSKIDNIEEIIKIWSGVGVDVNQDDLSAASDFVTSAPERNSQISNYTPSGSNGTILNANSTRKQLYVQNLATGALYIKYGSIASNNSFNFILAGTTYPSGGNGGSLSDLSYTGAVSATGVPNNLNPSYICWERS
jgi:hypothetical protein